TVRTPNSRMKYSTPGLTSGSTPSVRASLPGAISAAPPLNSRIAASKRRAYSCHRSVMWPPRIVSGTRLLAKGTSDAHDPPAAPAQAGLSQGAPTLNVAGPSNFVQSGIAILGGSDLSTRTAPTSQPTSIDCPLTDLRAMPTA